MTWCWITRRIGIGIGIGIDVARTATVLATPHLNSHSCQRMAKPHRGIQNRFRRHPTILAAGMPLLAALGLAP